MSTPKDNFESRIARVFGGLEKSSSSNPLAEKAISKDSLSKGGNKPFLQSKWNRTTPPRLDSPESDDGIEANSGSDEEDGAVVAKGKEYRHAVLPQLVPDHVQNPQKWKKYDLSEEGAEETEFKGLQGDQLNKRVAFQFLGDLRKRKSLEQGVRLDDDDDQKHSDEKIVFQRPRPRDAQLATATTRGGTGVVTMPQYEFGGKPPTQKRAKVVRTKDFDSPKSDEEEEEEEEDVGDDEYAYKGTGAKKNVQLPHLVNADEKVEDKEEDDDDDDEGSGNLKIYDVGSDDSNSNGPNEAPSPSRNEEEDEEGSDGEDA